MRSHFGFQLSIYISIIFLLTSCSNNNTILVEAEPKSDSNVSGMISFSEMDEVVVMKATFSGLTPVCTPFTSTNLLIAHLLMENRQVVIGIQLLNHMVLGEVKQATTRGYRKLWSRWKRRCYYYIRNRSMVYWLWWQNKKHHWKSGNCTSRERRLGLSAIRCSRG